MLENSCNFSLSNDSLRELGPWWCDSVKKKKMGSYNKWKGVKGDDNDDDDNTGKENHNGNDNIDDNDKKDKQIQIENTYAFHCISQPLFGIRLTRGHQTYAAFVWSCRGTCQGGAGPHSEFPAALGPWTLLCPAGRESCIWVIVIPGL